jgi:RNA polymerase sigma-70 factor, ECF subfamily
LQHVEVADDREVMADRTAAEPASLVVRAAGGDEYAVASLYDRFAGPLYGFGMQRLGNPELAEQLVQDVMTRVWRHAGRYDPARGSVATWVFAIARTTAVDLHRRHRRDPEPAVPEDVPSPVDELELLLQAELVRAALERLSAEHREVLEMAHVRGLRQTDIADRLGLPLGTVKSRTYYALHAFRLACEELGVGR